MTGLPVGAPVHPLTAARPAPATLEGSWVRLVPLSPEHANDLWDLTEGPGNDGLWTYLFDGPYRDRAGFDASIRSKSTSADMLFFAITDSRTNRAVGYASYLRIEPAHRCIEVGNILFTPLLQRTPGATEAMYLMARHVFEDLGYRRYEWKCHALNAPSRRAALRLGFEFEGIFRQHMIVKGRNRDTAWFSMLDASWPTCRSAFACWLDPSNFTPDGVQIRSLAEIRER